MSDARPKILLVDDEEGVLIGLNRLLHGRFEVSLATSAADGLQLIEAHDFEVVISDMRMPQMSGTEFLKRVKARRPLATRMILSGHSDLEAAASAINDGQVFRFLIKPAKREVLVSAIEAGVELRRLRIAESELLEQTLNGAVDALSETLALANPEAFGRARRLRRIVSALAKEAGLARRWALEIAASLSQMGAITVPAEVTKRHLAGEKLSLVEQAMVTKAHEVPRQLLRKLPRIEPVLELLDALASEDALTSPLQSLEGSALRMAALVERKLAAGETMESILAGLEGDAKAERVLVDALHRMGNLLLGSRSQRQLEIQSLVPGMVLVDDVRTRAGALLITRGHEVSESLLVRLRNFAATVGVREPLTVAVPDEAA